MHIIVIILMVLAFASLGSALYFTLSKHPNRSRYMFYALVCRVSFSACVLAIILYRIWQLNQH